MKMGWRQFLGIAPLLCIPSFSFATGLSTGSLQCLASTFAAANGPHLVFNEPDNVRRIVVPGEEVFVEMDLSAIYPVALAKLALEEILNSFPKDGMPARYVRFNFLLAGRDNAPSPEIANLPVWQHAHQLFWAALGPIFDGIRRSSPGSEALLSPSNVVTGSLRVHGTGISGSGYHQDGGPVLTFPIVGAGTLVRKQNVIYQGPEGRALLMADMEHAVPEDKTQPRMAIALIMNADRSAVLAAEPTFERVLSPLWIPY